MNHDTTSSDREQADERDTGHVIGFGQSESGIALPDDTDRKEEE